MDIADLIEAKRQSRLDAYRVARSDIREHAGIEETVLAGGYGYRQVLELVQNGADAILEESEQTPDAQGRTRIEVILHEHHLYVANTGAPLSEEGVEALLQSHSSPKRGNQIGRFGLGFKSLLRLGGAVGHIQHQQIVALRSKTLPKRDTTGVQFTGRCSSRRPATGLDFEAE